MATGKLREVEEDAIRIQEKRFRDQLEEQEYQKSKQQAKIAPKETVSGGETYDPSEEQKGNKK